MIRFLTKRILSCVDLFYMQSQMDADRIKELGADPSRVHIAGNLKFDQTFEAATVSKEEAGFPADADLLVAGSTHPGEEEILIDIFEHTSVDFPRLILVLVPRHIERTEGIEKLVEEKGYRPIRYSSINQQSIDPKCIIIVDSIGQLPALYGLATVVFIGKSFAVGGGQNMIEPAGLGKPVVVGPMTSNFKDVVRIFLESGGLVQVKDRDELFHEIKGLLKDRKRAEQMGQSAFKAVRQHQGATAKALDALTVILNRAGGS